MRGPRALTTSRLSLILVCACLQADCVVGQRLALPSGSGRISGRVLSSSSEPIEDAMVTLMEHAASGLVWPPPPAISDRNGMYVFDKLSPGRYSVFVEEISIRKRGYSTTRYSPGEFEVTSRSLDLEPGGDETQIDLVVWKKGGISGRLFNTEGSPMTGPRASVSFDDPVKHSTFFDVRTVEIDAEGRYTIRDAPPGTYRMSILNSPHAGRLVTVAEAAMLTDVDLYDMGPSTVTLQGLALDESGRVPSNLRVEYAMEHDQYRALHTVRDPDGHFTITDTRLRPGPLTVFVSGDTARGSVVGTATIEARFGTNELHVMTRTPGTVRGRVVWEPGTQRPAQLALVPLGFRPLGEGEPVVTVAQDGSFEVQGLAGQYLVEVRSSQSASTITAVRRNGRSLTSVVVAEGEIVDGLEVTVAPR